MAVGTLFAPEWRTYTDRATGTSVRQLTDYRGHSHHFYFTNPGWYDGGRKLLFASDRANRTNLYSVDLECGEIRQLTDLAPLPLPREVEFTRACINPVRDEAYFVYGMKLIALDLRTLQQNVLTEVTAGFDISMLNCTADGRYVCVGIWQDLSGQIETDLLRGYVGFAETWAAMPMSRILRVATDGSGSTDIVFEERYWIGHINTSPTQPNLITYCHEGPWEKVDNRIWGLDLGTGYSWQIRPRASGEVVGHEYWYADGVTIGYHGHLADGRKIMGRTRYDNTQRSEVAFPHETGHIHSNDQSLIVGDAGSVRLWRWNGTGYDGPAKLCEHRCSFHIQQLHVHPRFNAQGNQVLFTSDISGYGNVYLADVPDFGSLPPA